MAFQIRQRWIQIRIEDDGAHASLSASADDGSRSATGSRDLELPKQLVKDLQDVIKDHADEVDEVAMTALHESRRVDAGDVSPGVKAIKLGGGLSLHGDAAGRKN
jgi:hypothetical protein